MVDTLEYLKERHKECQMVTYLMFLISPFKSKYQIYNLQVFTIILQCLLLSLVLLPDGLLRERLRLAESLVQRDDALSEMWNIPGLVEK